MIEKIHLFLHIMFLKIKIWHPILHLLGRNKQKHRENKNQPCTKLVSSRQQILSWYNSHSYNITPDSTGPLPRESFRDWYLTLFSEGEISIYPQKLNELSKSLELHFPSDTAITVISFLTLGTCKSYWRRTNKQTPHIL